MNIPDIKVVYLDIAVVETVGSLLMRVFLLLKLREKEEDSSGDIA